MKRNTETSFFLHENRRIASKEGSYLSNRCRTVLSLPLSIITLSMFDWCTLLSHHKTQMTSVFMYKKRWCLSVTRINMFSFMELNSNEKLTPHNKIPQKTPFFVHETDWKKKVFLWHSQLLLSLCLIDAHYCHITKHKWLLFWTLCKALAASVVAITLKISQGSEKAGPMTALWQQNDNFVQISWGIFKLVTSLRSKQSF